MSNYWRQAMSDIGPAPGRRSGYNAGQYGSTPWANLYGGGQSAGLGSPSFYGTTEGMPSATGPNVLRNYGGGYSPSGYNNGTGTYTDPMSGISYYNPPSMGYTSGAGFSMPDFGSFFSDSWSTPTSEMMGVETPEIERPEYIQPSLPIAEWKDYPGLDYALANMDSIYPKWERIAPEGFDRLETAIRDKITLPLDVKQGQDTTRFWGEAAKRGLGDDPAAFKLLSETILDPYATQNRIAATDATQQRYALEAADKQAYNQGLTSRVNTINDTMTYRTDQENKFNQWRTGESDTRANMENGFNMTGAQMANQLRYGAWTTLQNQWLQLMALWASLVKTQGSGSGSGWNFGAGVGTKQ